MLDRPGKDLLRDAVDRGPADARHLPGPPAAGLGAGRPVDANPPGQQLGLLDVGWTDAAGERPAHRPAERRARRDAACTGTTTSSPAAARRPRCWPRRRPGEIQAVRFAPAVPGACSGTPRSTCPCSVSWAEGDRADHLERGIDQQALLDEIDGGPRRAGHRLATAGRPVPRPAGGGHRREPRQADGPPSPARPRLPRRRPGQAPTWPRWARPRSRCSRSWAGPPTRTTRSPGWSG